MLNFISDVRQSSGDVLTRRLTLRTEQFTTKSTMQNKLSIEIQQFVYVTYGLFEFQYL